MKHIVFALLCAALPATADCPKPADISAAMDALIERAHAADNDLAGREVSGDMWKLWLTAPDATAQDMLERGMRARAGFDFPGARQPFDRLIAYCPDYAEGFNQRAFVSFLTEDYAAALDDLDAALALSPRHVGALSGRALTLMNLGRLSEARAQLRAALEINPWLSERSLLLEGGPLAPDTKDI